MKRGQAKARKYFDMYKMGYQANPCFEMMQHVALAMYMEGFKEGEKSKTREYRSDMEAMQDRVEEAEETYLTEESFLAFWKMYDKKKQKIDCARQWRRLSKHDRKAIFLHLPEYIMHTPDKKYRKDPIRYLKHRGWEDEVIPDQRAEQYRERMQRTGQAEKLAELLVKFHLDQVP